MLISRGPMGEALEPMAELVDFGGGRPVVSHWGPAPIVIEHRLSWGTALLLVGVVAAFVYVVYELSRRDDLPIVEGIRE